MKGGTDNDIWRENQASQNGKEADSEATCRKINAKHNSISDWEKISVNQIWTPLSFYVAFWK